MGFSRSDGYITEGVKNTEEVTIGYKKNPNHDADEFKRQVEGQTNGLNDLNAGEIKENIENYRKMVDLPKLPLQLVK